MTTLRSRIHVLILAAALYLTAPLVESVYYETQLSRGAYPTNADSIGIPLYFFTFGLLMFLPVVAVLVWLGVRAYRGGLSFLAFDGTRPVRSVAWSVLLGGPGLVSAGFAVVSLLRAQWLDGVQSALWAYLFLCLRSSFAGPSSTRADG